MFTLTPARTAVPLRQQEAGARTSLLVGGIPTLICGLLALPVLARIDRKAPQPDA